MKIKIKDAIKFIREKEKENTIIYDKKNPQLRPKTKKNYFVTVEDEIIIWDMTLQGKKISSIYRELKGRYHYDTVWRHVNKCRIAQLQNANFNVMIQMEGIA